MCSAVSLNEMNIISNQTNIAQYIQTCHHWGLTCHVTSNDSQISAVWSWDKTWKCLHSWWTLGLKISDSSDCLSRRRGGKSREILVTCETKWWRWRRWRWIKCGGGACHQVWWWSRSHLGPASNVSESRLLWSSLRLWKFGKLAFALYIKAVIFAWCQSAFCCWRMGSRAGSKLKPMFSSLIWGLNSIFWESTAKMHNVESSNRTHSFCIIYKNHQTSTFHITLSLNWFDRGILLTLKAVAISCQEPGKIHFPNWMPSSKVRRTLVSLILQTSAHPMESIIYVT